MVQSVGNMSQNVKNVIKQLLCLEIIIEGLIYSSCLSSRRLSTGPSPMSILSAEQGCDKLFSVSETWETQISNLHLDQVKVRFDLQCQQQLPSRLNGRVRQNHALDSSYFCSLVILAAITSTAANYSITVSQSLAEVRATRQQPLQL